MIKNEPSELELKVQNLQAGVNNLTKVTEDLKSEIVSIKAAIPNASISSGTSIANKTKEERITYCNSLDYISKEQCLEALAVDLEDPLLCTSDDRCITTVAIKYNKPNYCNLAFYSSSCLEATQKVVR